MKRMNYWIPRFCAFLTVILLSTVLQATNKKDKCVECFSTEIISIEKVDDCITISLEISADKTCRFALSHFVVAIPCGSVTEAWNSGGWKMEYIITDPTTGVRGLKVDDIKGFGERRKPGSFTLTYTVCGDSECLETILKGFEVSYKAAWCVYYEELIPDVDDQADELTAQMSATHVSCFGASDGSVAVEVAGGELPYIYLWENGAETAVLENVPAGQYSVVITDAAGSSIELSKEVTQPSIINVAASYQPATCTQPDGHINLTVTGGTGDFQYEWSHGEETANVYGLAVGSYSVKVTDEAGCSVSRTYYVNSQSPIQISGVTNRPACHETNGGTIDINITGGTEPYSFKWSNGATTQNLTGLRTGSYHVTVTDAEGCTQMRSFSITREVFFASVQVIHADCQGEGGAAILTPNNGTAPYTANWSTGDTGLEVENLPAGQHSVLITDANGCQISQQVNIQADNAIQLNVTVSSQSCDANGSVLVDLSASGGEAPYQFYLDGELTDTQFSIDADGNYLISVADQKGCTASESITVNLSQHSLSLNVEISQPDCFNPQTGVANLQISGGTEPYAIYWNDVEESVYEKNLPSGNYEIQVIDALGCKAFSSFIINEITLPTVNILPADDPECESINNLVYAEIINADDFEWMIDSESSGWMITNYNATTLHYSAGTGSAVISLMATSPDGCEAMDFIEVVCTADDNGNDDDTGTPGDGDDSDSDDGDLDDGGNPDDGDDDTGEQPDDGCMKGCIWLDKVVVTSSFKNCTKYELTFVTDGSCRYDLSHLVIDLDGHSAYKVSNSRNWKQEINRTDPKSGLTGIKIDEIKGFGKTAGDSFTVSFKLCDAGDFNSGSFLVAFKAGNCLEIVELSSEVNSVNAGSLQMFSYPNPSADDTWFEFESNVDTRGKLIIYNQAGVPVETLFDGKMRKGVVYRTKFSGKGNDKILFYQMVTGHDKKDGKLLRIGQ
ncbi:SprB repeat-containing protein [Natronoflexus pectinivorans]|uniref:SprB-like repeat protein n=1 Tax=Natronoflexus pectinivorans TaxID=682526 RepID=A0A4R2GLH9_9BACT|nr:SprB repeat-containing protein [Natronoflexus pectinivorans]TCO09854.1 SprB-like repeat protein [Natronoflexus pectinivorans]